MVPEPRPISGRVSCSTRYSATTTLGWVCRVPTIRSEQVGCRRFVPE